MSIEIVDFYVQSINGGKREEAAWMSDAGSLCCMVAPCVCRI